MFDELKKKADEADAGKEKATSKTDRRETSSGDYSLHLMADTIALLFICS